MPVSFKILFVSLNDKLHTAVGRPQELCVFTIKQRVAGTTPSCTSCRTFAGPPSAASLMKSLGNVAFSVVGCCVLLSRCRPRNEEPCACLVDVA